MYRVGDEVIVMSASGYFRIVAIDGNVLTIENAHGMRKQVFGQAVRTRETKPAKEES